MKLGILGSTRGTHLGNLLTAIDQGKLSADITVVISNKLDAFILERARARGIPAVHISSKGLDRETYDREVQKVLSAHGVELVVMIGYMRIVSSWFVAQWPKRMLNVHPSLLPRHAGLMDLSVHQAVLTAGDTETGCTVHFVEEIVDGGEIILQKSCPVAREDSAETLKVKVQQLEGEALIAAINMLTRRTQ